MLPTNMPAQKASPLVEPVSAFLDDGLRSSMLTLISPGRSIVTRHKWKGRYNSQLAIGYTIP
jgi:hypothetical protein